MKLAAHIKSLLEGYYSAEGVDVICRPVSGGDIHTCSQLDLVGVDGLPERLFVKSNSGVGGDVLRTEFESLNAINDLCSESYPEALLFEECESEAVLIMSFHRLTSLDNHSAAQAGRALAQQHKVACENFGWATNNYIGLTPQSNAWSQSWVDFFRSQRLLPMLNRAKQQGLSELMVSSVEQVMSCLDGLLPHNVVPSLVHGDLWGGNLAYDRDALKPLFYDPAPYYGDREVDLAMTRLFGELPASFYLAYEEVWPLEPGYRHREAVYNLYHALNHVVLFGLSYESLVDSCLAKIDC